MKNEIKVKGDIATMQVLHNKTGRTFEAKCDIDDMAILQKHYWVMSKTAASVVCNYRQDGKLVKPTLHKILTGQPFVEFLNGDRLDFRRSNLRPVEKRISTKRIGVTLKGNPCLIHDKKVTFFITDRKGTKTGLAFIIDRDDLDKVVKYTWCINPLSGYVQTKTRGGRDGSKGLYLHRLIMAAGKGEQVDHINRQKTDNRKSNLRICTGSQNLHNTSTHSNNRFWIKGVSPDGIGWRAYMQVGHKPLYKYCTTFAQAVEQRKEWEQEYNPSGLEL